MPRGIPVFTSRTHCAIWGQRPSVVARLIIISSSPFTPVRGLRPISGSSTRRSSRAGSGISVPESVANGIEPLTREMPRLLAPDPRERGLVRYSAEPSKSGRRAAELNRIGPATHARSAHPSLGSGVSRRRIAHFAWFAPSPLACSSRTSRCTWFGIRHQPRSSSPNPSLQMPACPDTIVIVGFEKDLLLAVAPGCHMVDRPVHQHACRLLP